MAGDWIKLEVATPDKPEIARLARKLSVSRSDAFLAIVRVLFWADTNVRDGFVPDLSPSEGDSLAHTLSGTFDALSHPDIGWIEIIDGGMQFINWDRHNGNSAKKRSSEAKKKQNQRRKCADVPSNVPEMSPCGGDKSGTREEKRREEYKYNTQAEADRLTGMVIRSEAFERFIKAYPRPASPESAWKVWQEKIYSEAMRHGKPDEQIENEIVSAAEEYRTSPSGQAPEGGQDYRPSAAKWLQGNCWEESRELWQQPNGKEQKQSRKKASTKTADEINQFFGAKGFGSDS